MFKHVYSLSTCLPKLATYDPGWNDPPPMPTAAAAATNQVTNAAKPRTSLNKRVAFPMQSSAASETTVKTTAEGLPLPYSTAKYQPPPQAPVSSASSPPQTISPPPTLPPPPSSLLSSGSPPVGSPSAPLPIDVAPSTTTDNLDSTSAREQCHSIFGQFADKMATSTHSTEPNKLNEIRKRLESLHHMWLEDKLDDAVQKNLYALAKGLFGL